MIAWISCLLLAFRTSTLWKNWSWKTVLNSSSLQTSIFRRITSVVGVQNLKSLKDLAITNCPELQLSPNEYLPCSLKFLEVSNCENLRSLPILHGKMSVLERLKLSKCPRLSHVCGLSDLPFPRCWIILDCPALLLSSEKRPCVNCPL